jgi:hypothetical protein
VESIEDGNPLRTHTDSIMRCDNADIVCSSSFTIPIHFGGGSRARHRPSAFLTQVFEERLDLGHWTDTRAE